MRPVKVRRNSWAAQTVVLVISLGAILAALAIGTASAGAAEIVLGESIAGISPGDSEDHVRARLGSPHSTTPSTGLDGGTQWLYLNLTVVLRDGGVASIHTFRTEMRTDRGIGPGSTRSETLQTYPDLDCLPFELRQCNRYSLHRNIPIQTTVWFASTDPAARLSSVGLTRISALPPTSPPPPPSPPSGTTCPTFRVIDSRGSGTTGVSAPGAIFASKLRHRHPDADVDIETNRYPAVGLLGNWRNLLNGAGALLGFSRLGAYHDSVVNGKRWLRKRLIALAVDSACPATKTFLTGYSQGAQVTGDVYQELGDTTAERRVRKRIAGVALFGDPYFNGRDTAVAGGGYSSQRSGVLGRRPKFGNVPVRSLCHKRDPICQAPLGNPTILTFRFSDHSNYQPDAEATARHFDR